MKPKKRVYLYCADYDRRNDLAFILRVRCPWARIEAFRTIDEIEDELRDDPEFGCVVLVAGDEGDRMADGQRRRGAEDDAAERKGFDSILRDPAVAMRAIEVWPKGKTPMQSVAGRTVTGRGIADLASAMQVAAERQRGPTPRRIVAAALNAAVAVAR